MKGYKAFDSNMRCRGFQYKVGETYTIEGKIALCERGFHFCKTPGRCFNFYPLFDSLLCEVEASGVIKEDEDKCVCSEIRIVRQIEGQERNRIYYGSDKGHGNAYGNHYGDGFGFGYNGNSYGSGTGCGFVGFGGSCGDGDGGGYGDGSNYNFYNKGHGTRIQNILLWEE